MKYYGSIQRKSSTEIDAYVAYNYIEKVWYYGTLARQAWLDRGIRTLPMATGGQYLYNHEVGYDDDGSAMTSFIESAPIDIGDGDKFVFLKRVIPDITFDGSTSVNPDVSFYNESQEFSGINFNETTEGTTQRSATSPIEQFTEKLDYRLRGRSFALRIDSTSLGTKYKLVHQELIYERMEEDNVNNKYSSIYTRLTNAKVDLTTTDVTFYTRT